MTISHQALQGLWAFWTSWVVSTDFDQRSQTSCSYLCDGVISYHHPIRGIQVFANYTHQKQIQSNRVWDLHPQCGISCLFSYVQTAIRAGDIHTWCIVVILITGKIQIPNCSIIPGNRWHQFLNIRPKPVVVSLCVVGKKLVYFHMVQLMQWDTEFAQTLWLNWRESNQFHPF